VNRSDLIRRFREVSGLGAREADWFVRRFFDVIAQGLEQDGRVELRGFGVFRISRRQQAGFQNPKDGRYYGAAEIVTVHFSPTQAGEANERGD